MYRKLDDFVIDKICQPISDYFVVKTTPQVIAQNFLIASSLILLWQVWLEWKNDTLNIIGIIFAPMLLVWIMTVAYSANKSNSLGVMPKERIIFYFLRLFLVIIFFLNLLVVYLNSKIVYTVAVLQIITELFGLYFLSCRRMPPRWQTQSEKIRGAVKNNV